MFAIFKQPITSLQRGLAALGPLPAAAIAPLWWPGRALLTVQRHLRALVLAGHLAAAIEYAVIDRQPRRRTMHYRAPGDHAATPPCLALRPLLLSLLATVQSLPGLAGVAMGQLHPAGGQVVLCRRSAPAATEIPAALPCIDLTTPRQAAEGDRTYLLISDTQANTVDQATIQAEVYAHLCHPSVWPAAYPPPLPLIIAATPARLPALRAAWRTGGFPRVLITTTQALVTDGWAQARWEEVTEHRRRDRILFEGWLPDPRIPANNDRWEPQEHWQRGPP